jgi:uncharacterized protein YndB with AHSA1/START domain
MKNRYSLEIDAPPERVFAWLGNSERALRWVPNLIESEDLEVTPSRIGSTFRHVYQERGRRMEMRGTVTAYETDRHFACELTSDMFDLSVDYRLESMGRRTRLTQESETHFKSLPLRLIGALLTPLMKKASQRGLADSFGKLKRLAEAADEPPARTA